MKKEIEGSVGLQHMCWGNFIRDRPIWIAGAFCKIGIHQYRAGSLLRREEGLKFESPIWRELSDH